MSHKLQAASSKPRASRYKLQATSDKLVPSSERNSRNSVAFRFQTLYKASQHLVNFLNSCNPRSFIRQVFQFERYDQESFNLLARAETHVKKLGELFGRVSTMSLRNVRGNRKCGTLNLRSYGELLSLGECLRKSVNFSAKVFCLLPNQEVSKASSSHSYLRGYHTGFNACGLRLVSCGSMLRAGGSGLSNG